jgi:hypothetical protein
MRLPGGRGGSNRLGTLCVLTVHTMYHPGHRQHDYSTLCASICLVLVMGMAPTAHGVPQPLLASPVGHAPRPVSRQWLALQRIEMCAQHQALQLQHLSARWVDTAGAGL